MGFSNSTPRTYINIKEGAVVISVKEDREDSVQDLINNAREVVRYPNKKGIKMLDIKFQSFEGYLQDIDLVEREMEVNGVKKKFKFWVNTFKDDDDQIVVWETIQKSSLFQSFINCIDNCDNLSEKKIKLLAWLKGDQTRITVYVGGEKASWKYGLDQMPQLEKVVVNEEEYWDHTKRLQWVTKVVEDIKAKLVKPGYDSTKTFNKMIPLTESLVNDLTDEPSVDEEVPF